MIQSESEREEENIMQWTIPGTTLLGQREDADRVDSVFRALFLAGGLTLSQVSGIAGLEP